MKHLIVVVDESCGPCSALGRELSDIEGVRAISADSNEAEKLGASHSAPCIVEFTEHGIPIVRRGWAMRIRLARHLGIGHANRWFALLDAEFKARTTRSGGMSRRSVLLGGVLTGLTLIIGSPLAAAASPKQSNVRTLTENEFTSAMHSLPSNSKIAAGDIHAGYSMGSGDFSAVALADKHGSLALIPDKYPEAALILGVAGNSLTYSTIDGFPLARVVTDSAAKRVSVEMIDGQSSVGPQRVQIPRAFVVCFGKCIANEMVDFNCIVSCVEALGGPVSSLGCLACAGPKAIKCAVGCRRYL